MTWNPPKNFKDNSIVTSKDWNDVLGEKGSLFTVNKLLLTRGSCNITSANIYDTTLTPTTTATTTIKRVQFRNSTGEAIQAPLNSPGYITILPKDESRGYYPFTNSDRTNTLELFDGIPFILLWSFRLSNNTGGDFPSTFRVRTTVEREFEKNISGSTTQTITETIACNFFEYHTTTTDNGLQLSSSLAYVSQSSKNKYYITISHHSSAALSTIGYVRLIINPGMV